MSRTDNLESLISRLQRNVLVYDSKDDRLRADDDLPTLTGLSELFRILDITNNSITEGVIPTELSELEIFQTVIHEQYNGDYEKLLEELHSREVLQRFNEDISLYSSDRGTQDIDINLDDNNQPPTLHQTRDFSIPTSQTAPNLVQTNLDENLDTVQTDLNSENQDLETDPKTSTSELTSVFPTPDNTPVNTQPFSEEEYNENPFDDDDQYYEDEKEPEFDDSQDPFDDEPELEEEFEEEEDSNQDPFDDEPELEEEVEEEEDSNQDPFDDEEYFDEEDEVPLEEEEEVEDDSQYPFDDEEYFDEKEDEVSLEEEVEEEEDTNQDPFDDEEYYEEEEVGTKSEEQEPQSQLTSRPKPTIKPTPIKPRLKSRPPKQQTPQWTGQSSVSHTPHQEPKPTPVPTKTVKPIPKETDSMDYVTNQIANRLARLRRRR